MMDALMAAKDNLHLSQLMMMEYDFCHLEVSICVYMCVYIYVNVCVCVYICVYKCVYVCVYVCGNKLFLNK